MGLHRGKVGLRISGGDCGEQGSSRATTVTAGTSGPAEGEEQG